jgi:hypothetical protein
MILLRGVSFFVNAKWWWLWPALLLACQSALPPMSVTEKTLYQQAQKLAPQLQYHHVSYSSHSIIVLASYPPRHPHQIELLGQAMLDLVPLFSTATDSIMLSLHVIHDDMQPEQKHYITWSRQVWAQHQFDAQPPPITAYELATDYYVGDLVSGTLARQVNGISGYLPRKLGF